MNAFSAFHPQAPATRATVLAIIVVVHVAGIAALMSMGGLTAIIQQVEPVAVRLLPAPARPVVTARPVPMPKLKPPEVRLPVLQPPEVRLPVPPPIENLYALRIAQDAVTPAPSPVAAPVSPAPPSPAPTLEPPRGDISYLDNPAPSYPPGSKRAGEQGRVTLRVRVDERGNVETIAVDTSSGFPRLDAAALAAVRRWRFLPARLGERAVAAWALVPIHFQLRG